MSTLPQDSFRLYSAVVFAAAACAHAFQFILQWRFLRRAFELGVLTSPFFASLQISFIVAFIAVAIGLLLRSRSGLIAAVIGLLLLLLNYAAWYAWSYRNLRIIRTWSFYREHPEHVPGSMFGLLHANWWDLPVLLFALLTLAYVIRHLLALRRQDRSS